MTGEKPIWREGAFRDDPWVRSADPEVALGPDDAILVPLPVLITQSDRLLPAAGLLGVEAQPGEHVGALEPYLGRIALIALAFPKFSDGRSYSAARLLRERLSYRGELRATGDVLADQIPLMRRCGFDSFEVHHSATRRALASGVLAEVRHFYQPLPLAREVPTGTRPWARLPLADTAAEKGR